MYFVAGDVIRNELMVLDTDTGKIKRYSKGMKQKVGIITANKLVAKQVDNGSFMSRR